MHSKESQNAAVQLLPVVAPDRLYWVLSRPVLFLRYKGNSRWWCGCGRTIFLAIFEGKGVVEIQGACSSRGWQPLLVFQLSSWAARNMLVLLHYSSPLQLFILYHSTLNTAEHTPYILGKYF